MSPDFRLVLRNSTLLRGASPAAYDKLVAIGRQREYPRGTMLFMQGETASAIGLVAQGWVKLFRTAPNGNEAVVRVFHAGEGFGEAVALRKQPYPVSAAAVTDCTVLWFDSDRLLQMIREDPEIAVAILASTFFHLHELVSQVEQLKSQNGAQRVAQFLLELCGPTQQGRAVVMLPYDKVLIAAQLGIKPESLSRAFARLRNVGVTIRNTEADIEEVGKLRAYAEENPGAVWQRKE